MVNDALGKESGKQITFLTRSSHQRCSLKKGVLKNFAKFTERHMCQSLFFNKVEGFSPFEFCTHKIKIEIPQLITHQKQPPEVFYEKNVLKNWTKFTGKYLCQSLRPAALLKKRLWHRCFPVNFVEFLRTPFLQNTSGRLLLTHQNS